MIKRERKICCKSCGAELCADAFVCPACGVKVKKPVYKKWWFWLIVIAAVALLFTRIRPASQIEDLEESYFYGTWTVSGITVDDSFYDMDYIKEKDADSYNTLSEILFVFNAGGEYFFGTKDKNEIEYWSYSSKGLVCDGETEAVKNGKIYIKNKDCYMVFEKVSDVQAFPSEADAELEETNENVEDNVELIDGMRPEFKEAIDAYVEFFEEYCDIMEQYAANPTDFSMLTKYADYMAKYAEYMEKLEALDDGTLNNAEAAYYLKASAKITEMLADVVT